MALVEKFHADMILLAGYVWATTDIVLDNYLVVNVHPADLAVTDETGHRLLAGANGIKSAFDRNMDYLACQRTSGNERARCRPSAGAFPEGSRGLYAARGL